MADDVTRNVLSVYATVSDRVKDLVIKDGQLIFVQDKHRIAFDFGGKRRFYNQIEELQTDEERVLMEEPVNGSFYFVINTAMLWRYENGWVQLTYPPEEVVFIGVELPELGSVKKLYVNKQKKNIAVWDDELEQYVVVADATGTISNEEINSLFV